MFCPETICYNGKHLLIMRWDRADYGCRRAPLLERVNVLRYQVTIIFGQRRLRINPKGRLALHWSNLNWWLWKKHLRAIARNHD